MVVGYWNTRALVQPIRVMLAYMEVPFEDRRFQVLIFLMFSVRFSERHHNMYTHPIQHLDTTSTRISNFHGMLFGIPQTEAICYGIVDAQTSEQTPHNRKEAASFHPYLNPSFSTSRIMWFSFHAQAFDCKKIHEYKCTTSRSAMVQISTRQCGTRRSLNYKKNVECISRIYHS